MAMQQLSYDTATSPTLSSAMMTANSAARAARLLPASLRPVPGNSEARESPRVRTVYRVVRIETDQDTGFARVRNMSDGGMKLSLTMPVTLGDVIRVGLTDETELEGRVVWTNGNDCGLQFAHNVDSVRVLRETAQHCRATQIRAPRLRAGLRAVATTEQGMKPVRVEDVSLRGMKLVHDGSFTPGLPVKVSFGSGIERRGVIRWANDTMAGLMLLEQFAVEDLGAISALES